MKSLAPGNKLLLFILFGIIVFTLLPGCPPNNSSTCLAPTELILDKNQIDNIGSRTLTYKWTAVPEAQNYRFTFARNNNQLIDTITNTNTITFKLEKGKLNPNDIMIAQVFTQCQTGISNPTTNVLRNGNGLVSNDIVFIGNEGSPLARLCQLPCEFYHFSDSIFISITGDTIRVGSSYRNYYYDDVNFRNILCSDSLTQAIFDSLIVPLLPISFDGPDSVLICSEQQ